MFKFLTSLLLAVFSLFITVNNVKAEDFIVNCSNSGCSSPGIAIFNKSDMLPGERIEKTVAVENNRSKDISINLSAGKKSQTDDIFLDVLSVEIRNSDNSLISSLSLADFLNGTKINLGNLASGARKSLILAITFDPLAGNAYQGKRVTFDIFFEISGDDVQSNPVTTVTTTQTTQAGPPACTDIKPGSAPVLTNVISGVNSATLYWTEGLGPISYYLITFGTSPGAQTYGNPNIGGSGTTSYTVNNLSGGTTYYFRIRAGNGCMPGDYSNELATNPTGGFVSGLPEGFIPGVLGTQTQETATISGITSEKPEVMGTSCLDKNYWWWLPLLLQAILVGFIFYRFNKNRRPLKSFIISGLILALISQIIHELLGCNCATSWWCSKYIIFNLIIFLTSSIAYHFFLKKQA